MALNHSFIQRLCPIGSLQSSSHYNPSFLLRQFPVNMPSLSNKWGRVTHTCVRKLDQLFGSDIALSPARHQAIIWIHVSFSLIGNFSEIRIKTQQFSFKTMKLKKSCANWRPFSSGFNELRSWFTRYSWFKWVSSVYNRILIHPFIFHADGLLWVCALPMSDDVTM